VVLPAAAAVVGGAGVAVALAELVDLVFGDEEGQALLATRLDAFLEQLGAGPLTAPQQRVATLVQAKVETLVRHSFSDLGAWQTQLRALANQLEDLETRARAMVDEAGESAR
jgi:hypothetical protein